MHRCHPTQFLPHLDDFFGKFLIVWGPSVLLFLYKVGCFLAVIRNYLEMGKENTIIIHEKEKKVKNVSSSCRRGLLHLKLVVLQDLVVFLMRHLFFM